MARVSQIICTSSFIAAFEIISLFSSTKQATAQSTWSTTRVDSIASVNMPYEGSLTQKAKYPNAWCYSTSTSDNEFAAYKFDLNGDKHYQGKSSTLTVSNFNKAIRTYSGFITPSISNAKLISEQLVQVDGAVGVHQVLQGVSESRQEAAVLEQTWVIIDKLVYLFSCTTLLPGEQSAQEDAKHFFLTIHFK
jgi:hypothetical protein